MSRPPSIQLNQISLENPLHHLSVGVVANPLTAIICLQQATPLTYLAAGAQQGLRPVHHGISFQSRKCVQWNLHGHSTTSQLDGYSSALISQKNATQPQSRDRTHIVGSTGYPVPAAAGFHAQTDAASGTSSQPYKSSEAAAHPYDCKGCSGRWVSHFGRSLYNGKPCMMASAAKMPYTWSEKLQSFRVVKQVCNHTTKRVGNIKGLGESKSVLRCVFCLSKHKQIPRAARSDSWWTNKRKCEVEHWKLLKTYNLTTKPKTNNFGHLLKDWWETWWTHDENCKTNSSWAQM